MDSILDQLPQREQSLSSLFASHVIERPHARKDFIDESYIKVNALRGKYPKTDVRRISIMVGFICPKGASESFIHDVHKECQIAKNYRARFWGLYNEAKKTK